jgi:hypothetical protein
MPEQLAELPLNGARTERLPATLSMQVRVAEWQTR